MQKALLYEDKSAWVYDAGICKRGSASESGCGRTLTAARSFLGQVVILLIRDGLAPFGGGVFAGDLEGEV